MNQILITLFVGLAVAFTEFNDQKSILYHYEDNSLTPLLHVYYDRHFKNSKQFEDFLDVLN